MAEFLKFDAAIPTYIINLRERIDRLVHVTHQFSNKPEFDVSIIDATRHETGTVGLWQNIVKVVAIAEKEGYDFVLICEDDHEFTRNYSKQHLFECIEEARMKQADVLSGGISSLRSALQVSASLFWTQRFTGLQFTILFRKFFKSILASEPGRDSPADHRISLLTSNSFFIYPFISIQRDFGYSDVTLANNEYGRVGEFFKQASETVQHLIDVNAFYRGNQNSLAADVVKEFLSNATISTYIINLPARKERRTHIVEQFKGREEFDVSIVDACEHEIGAVGLWHTIRKIIQMAVSNQEDLIIICEDDHMFTDFYSKEVLFKNIMEAHLHGADILSGGIGGGFTHALPISKDRFWVNHFFCTQFIVVYSKFFQILLDEPFDDTVTADDFISTLTSNKMVIYPFISIQRDFGYSDVTHRNNLEKGLITSLFEDGESKLRAHRTIYEEYLHGKK